MCECISCEDAGLTLLTRRKKFCSDQSLPTDVAGVPVQIKEIDYIINLIPDDDRAVDAFKEMPNYAESSFNQTTDEFHRYSPIAINIEGKKEHGIDPS